MSNTLFKWCTDNLLKANPEKSHFLTNSAQEIQIIIAISISNSKCEKLLGIHIDNKLTFESHVRCLCKKISQKLSAFARIAYSLKFNQRKLLLNAFITSQCSYPPLAWMFHNRKLNNHLNRIHERTIHERALYIKNITQRLMKFLQKTVPPKFMTVISRNYLPKWLELK